MCNIYQYSLVGVAKTRVITITIRLRLAPRHSHSHKSVLAFAMYIHHSFTRTHERRRVEQGERKIKGETACKQRNYLGRNGTG